MIAADRFSDSLEGGGDRLCLVRSMCVVVEATLCRKLAVVGITLQHLTMILQSLTIDSIFS